MKNNRQIKFRVWDLIEKKWIKDFCVITDCGSIQIYNSYGIPTPPRKRVSEGEEYIVQQFTGLYDKNGREIYEGDILKVSGFRENMEVRIGDYDDWVNENSGIGVFSYGKKWGDWGLTKEQQKGIEIIGNIFENPELINEL